MAMKIASLLGGSPPRPYGRKGSAAMDDSIPRTPAEYRAWWHASTEVDFGTCWCGCGERTVVSLRTDRRSWRLKGQPVRYRMGHQHFKRTADALPRTAAEYRTWWEDERPDIPYGRCWCGCGGNPEMVAGQTATRMMRFHGEPMRYVHGHNGRNALDNYLAEDRGHATPCHIWRGASSEKGYGRLIRDKRTHYAHRLIYEKAYGPVEDGKHLHHLCEQPACVNPAHLVAVTPHEHRLLHGENHMAWGRKVDIR